MTGEGPRTGRHGRRALLVDAVAIAVVHAILCVGARLAGFDHVSDDDFARVTIAQAFAHAPRLDPSGTSWLPFPFWALGGALALTGRSLAAAHAASLAIASIAAAAPYVALRGVGVPRGRALVAVALALGTPWCVWLGASPVPESFTATLTAAGVVALGATSEDRTATRLVPFALAIAAATLSRYEAWPVAAVLASALGARALRARSTTDRVLLGAAAVICALGPLAWMAWNAHAHDGALHFFRRVSRYKRAIGAGSTDTISALALYPRLFFTTRPELAVPLAFALAPALRDRELRRRWLVPLACVGAQLAFLAYGNARDGAPAHHPERALVGAWVIVGLFVADAGLVLLRGLVDRGLALAARGLAVCVAAAWVISTMRGADMPGQGTSDDRSAQVARGLLLRAETPALIVTPCAFEHFALVAAYGAPERVEVRPAAPSRDCPRVETP